MGENIIDKLFLTILNMSLTGAFVIAAICITRLPCEYAFVVRGDAAFMSERSPSFENRDTISPNVYNTSEEPEEQSLLVAIIEEAEIESITTIDEAMNWYMRVKQSQWGLPGDFYAATYRILGIDDSVENSVTIYAHTLNEWISRDGTTMSSSASVISVTFNKSNDIYEYDSSVPFMKELPNNAPQKVRDAVADGSYFYEMVEEVEAQITAYLKNS